LTTTEKKEAKRERERTGIGEGNGLRTSCEGIKKTGFFQTRPEKTKGVTQDAGKVLMPGRGKEAGGDGLRGPVFTKTMVGKGCPIRVSDRIKTRQVAGRGFVTNTRSGKIREHSGCSQANRVKKRTANLLVREKLH